MSVVLNGTFLQKYLVITNSSITSYLRLSLCLALSIQGWIWRVGRQMIPHRSLRPLFGTFTLGVVSIISSSFANENVCSG